MHKNIRAFENPEKIVGLFSMAPQFFCIKLAFNTFLSICLTKLVMDMYIINGYLKKQDLGYL